MGGIVRPGARALCAGICLLALGGRKNVIKNDDNIGAIDAPQPLATQEKSSQKPHIPSGQHGTGVILTACTAFVAVAMYAR